MDPFDLRLWPGFEKAGGQVSDPTYIDQIAIDSRRIHSKQALFIALQGEREDGHAYVAHAANAGAAYALVNHSWHAPSTLAPIRLLRVEDPLLAFQEIARYYRLQLPTKIIAITGSYGKTMVKDLLYSLLNTQKIAAASPESFNSQIGVPLSLLTLRKEHEIAVIEAAISLPTEIEKLVNMIQPDHALLTPIGKKHLATLGNLSTVASETMKLVQSASSHGWKLLPNDPLLQSYTPHLLSCYSWDEPHAELPHASINQKQPILPTPYHVSFPDDTPFQGTIQNGFSYFINLVNMAVKAAWLSGISSASIKEILKEYNTEPMRTEIWKSPIGATFINDIYCSDPQSVDQAFRYFNQASPTKRQIFLFGGMRGDSSQQKMDYKRIGQALNHSNIQSLVLFGQKEFSPLIQEVRNSSPHLDITRCENYEEALNYLKIHLKSDDLVLIKGDTKKPLDTITEAFNDSLNNNQCTINLAAIRSNIAHLNKITPPNTRLMAIVKAFAYGTDDIQISKFLSSCGVGILGVSYVDEGVNLKRAGVTLPIFSINAASYEIAKVVKWELEVGVGDADFILLLAKEAEKKQKTIKVHLHINTGMGRFGCRIEEALNLAKLITLHKSLVLEGIMTHFPCADDPLQDDFTREQIRNFDETIAKLADHGIRANWVHAANSSGTIRFYLPQYNMVRIGLAIYGLYGSEAGKQAIDLRLALTLTSRIVGINLCKKGETISYGRHYKVQKETQKIAVLPIGYFDGIHRSYSEKSFVQIRGYQAPMVGKICMDYMMIDVTDIPGVAVGDKVLIFGEDEFGQYVSPEELATSGDSIVYELVTCLGPRIQRIFVFEEGRQIR